MKFLASLALLAAASPCLAGPFWVGASGSYNTYAMDDVNADIHAFNTMFAPLSMNTIDSGIGFGLSAGTDVNRWSFSIAYDRLPASSDMNGMSLYHMAADTFLGRVACRLPLQAKFGILVGVGAGIASTSSTVGDHGDPIVKIGRSTQAVIYEGGTRVSGSAFSYEGFVEGDMPLGGKFALVPSLGYRSAKIDAETTGTVVTTLAQTIDFSGMAARLGLRFAL